MSRILDSLLRQAANPSGVVGRRLVRVWATHFAPMAVWGLAALPDGAAAVLDIGCGGGAGVRAALARWPEAVVTGADISPVSVAATLGLNKQAARRGRVNAAVADVASLPFAAESFDVVLALQTHVFWPDIPQGLSELYRVLRPGGCLLLVCEQDKLQYHLAEQGSGAAHRAWLAAAGFARVDSGAQGTWQRWLAYKKEPAKIAKDEGRPL